MRKRQNRRSEPTSERMPERFCVRVKWNEDRHTGFTFTDPQTVVTEYRRGPYPPAPLTRKEDIREFFDNRVRNGGATDVLYFFPAFVCIGGDAFMREADADSGGGKTVSYINISRGHFRVREVRRRRIAGDAAGVQGKMQKSSLTPLQVRTEYAIIYAVLLEEV